jgi:hypothetical protein
MAWDQKMRGPIALKWCQRRFLKTVCKVNDWLERAGETWLTMSLSSTRLLLTKA